MPGQYVNKGGFWIKHRKDGDREQYLSGQFTAECPNCHHEFSIPIVQFENAKKKGNQPDWIASKDNQERNRDGNR